MVILDEMQLDEPFSSSKVLDWQRTLTVPGTTPEYIRYVYDDTHQHTRFDLI